jgi:predicted neuraminidase
MNKPWQRWVWLAAAAALYMLPVAWLGWSVSPARNRKFAVPPAGALPAEAPAFEHEEFIEPAFKVPRVHVSSLCELPDGRLAAAWYAGSREGAKDVVIEFATRAPGATGTWSAPKPIVTRESAARDGNRYVKKVGNSLLFSGAEGQLYLLYVSIALGGWSGSSLNITKSPDGGQTWSAAQPLGLSPFFNISTLVKNGPAPLAGGGWAVPVYHEMLGKFPEVLWLEETRNGFKAAKTRVAGGRFAFQPSLVALNSQTALVFSRAAGELRKIYKSHTTDGGVTWSRAEAIELPNSNSGLDVLRLADGRLLLAFNDTPKNRENLKLAVSTGEGKTWQRAAVLEEQAGEEFSYPFLLQARDGTIHLTYTWKRVAIKHVSFNVAWLNGQLAKTK